MEVAVSLVTSPPHNDSQLKRKRWVARIARMRKFASRASPGMVPMRHVQFIILAVACAVGGGCWSASVPPSTQTLLGSDEALARAFEQHTSNVQVEGQGVVRRVLPDDNDGSRHQRFVVGLSSGQTLLIAHNIDLAPRIVGLHEGDNVSFSGEYEWNASGGEIHWTHHDPGKRHPPGWIKHNGQVYQ
jgi:hypothetical protein